MTHTFTNRRCTLQFFLLRQICCEYGNVTYSDRTGPGQVSQVPSKAHQTPRKMVKETHTWLIKNAFFVHIIALPHHSPSTTVTTRTTSTTMRMAGWEIRIRIQEHCWLFQSILDYKLMDITLPGQKKNKNNVDTAFLRPTPTLCHTRPDPLVIAAAVGGWCWGHMWPGGPEALTWNDPRATPTKSDRAIEVS